MVWREKVYKKVLFEYEGEQMSHTDICRKNILVRIAGTKLWSGALLFVQVLQDGYYS